ncbi:PH domain-containing protein [Olivibacter sp. XZL3]|uniref:PH domain-containing protein n=1 Tax=Olivibacter sp. XZL3 TaxID=1735116 RepID=UPI001064EE04|nr:PH domain-containing protein [Olivibacter sp. XZL3]
MQKYNAKIDRILFIPVMVIMGGSTLFVIFKAATDTDRIAAFVQWGIALLLLAVTAFSIHLFLTTYYVIDGNVLIIRSGLLYRTKVEIDSIRKVQETNNPISAPATSLDRLEIFYNRLDSIIVSPKDKQGFIEELLKQNPSVEMLYKKSGR